MKVRRKGSKKMKAHVCLFVFHIPAEATEDELTQLFSQYGKVGSVRIMFHGEGSPRRVAALSRAGLSPSEGPLEKESEAVENAQLPFESRGFGFVNMFSIEDAQRAIVKLNGHRLHSKYLKVSFKKPKDKLLGMMARS